MTYYEILDVPPDATQEQIKYAYRILVQLHHPDRLQQVSPSVREYAEERLKKINAAYQVLGDVERRAAYDASQTRAQRAPAHADYGWQEAGEAAPDQAREASRRRGRRRPKSAEEAAAEAAYEEWAHKEAERYAEAREAERARQAERERREAEARARRAAAEQFPRVRRSEGGDEVVVTFAAGVWTSLRRVPAGQFLMGAQPSRDPEATPPEQPQHSVHVSEYFIGRYPVTVAQFRAFARAANYALPHALPADQEALPVTRVAWDDAVAFCGWLKKLTGRAFRLPTEAEWEKAARGTDGRLYPWGNELDPARANARPNPAAPARPTPVGQYSPAGDSPYGVADLCGNVWEWCADWFDGKTYSRRQGLAVRDPQGPATGPGYVARGGAFDTGPHQLRASHRNWFFPDERRANLGFRIVVEPF
jgi:formylglycine-generating enzyme required for sulfatase activity